MARGPDRESPPSRPATLRAGIAPEPPAASGAATPAAPSRRASATSASPFPDIEAACRRFDERGIEFQKRLRPGGMKEIAFIKDPDSYWIQIVQPGLMQDLVGKGAR